MGETTKEVTDLIPRVRREKEYEDEGDVFPASASPAAIEYTAQNKIASNQLYPFGLNMNTHSSVERVQYFKNAAETEAQLTRLRNLDWANLAALGCLAISITAHGLGFGRVLEVLPSFYWRVGVRVETEEIKLIACAFVPDRVFDGCRACWVS
ncbi:hypothetical protein BKA56DRAFT_623122 [Ilyonectria sp. MPI-CAGE-AT-0026]|nr:hypothetical protein BKA56DRAFT_623122 [Ilyonectria sp. MPI-CAGE-AT-0026]